MYAIVRSGSKQQKVVVGDVIEIDRTDEVAGASLSLPVVMVVDGEKVTSTGLDKAAVTVEVGRVAVFCGSNPGTDPVYAEAAAALGRTLAERGIGLVYGGGAVGLMGIVADAVLAGGGEVVGVIPQLLWDKEVGHRGLTELLVVASMHERKLAMADRADAFIGLPGGVGTFEELFEAITWTQLGIHTKPVTGPKKCFT